MAIKPCDDALCGDIERDRDYWRALALHSLTDLRALGVDISRIGLMRGTVLEQVIEFERDGLAYS